MGKGNTVGVKKVLPPSPNPNEERKGKISFDKSKVLGTGCGKTVVYQGKFENRPVAVKKILRDDSTSSVRESDLLQICDDHPNVIRYYCMEKDLLYIYIALDLCEATLGDWVEGAYPNSTIDGVQILKDACEGLAHLHKVQVVHRDLKPANILLRKGATGNEMRAVISDFGFSKEIRDGRMSYSANSGIIGTNGWIAPEILKKLMGNNPGISLTTAVDVFSMGCVIYYVLTFTLEKKGCHPFGDPIHRQSNIDKNEHKLDKLLEDSRGVVALIKLMISGDPRKRPPIDAVLSHPLFWSMEKVDGFFTDISNRISKKNAAEFPLLKKFENGGGVVVKNNWTNYINRDVLNELKTFRTYKGGSVRDLLRALRNSTNHFYEMSTRFQTTLGGSPVGVISHWMEKFPALLPFTWETFEELKGEELFKKYYHPKFNFGDGIVFSKSIHIPAVPEASAYKFFLNTIEIPSKSPATSPAKSPAKQRITGKLPTIPPVKPNTGNVAVAKDEITNTGQTPKTILKELCDKNKISAKWEFKEISKSPATFECLCTIPTKTGAKTGVPFLRIVPAQGVAGNKKAADYAAAFCALINISGKSPKMILNETCVKKKVTPEWSNDEISKTPSAFKSVCRVPNTVGGVITGEGNGVTKKEAEHVAALHIIQSLLTTDELSRLMSGVNL